MKLTFARIFFLLICILITVNFCTEPNRKKTSEKRKVITNRHRWTPEEIAELKTIFEQWFKEDSTPGNKVIAKAKQHSKEKNGLIWKLESDKIKKKISWMRLHPKE